MTAPKKAKRCPTCGEGQLEYSARRGRMFSFKGFDYPIPTTMKLVECSHCHELHLSPDEVEAIEGPIAETHQKRMAALVDESLKALEGIMAIGQLEKALHLSQGYLARARTKGDPSFPLAALLKILAEHPRKRDVLDELASLQPFGKRT